MRGKEEEKKRGGGKDVLHTSIPLMPRNSVAETGAVAAGLAHDD